MTVAGRSGSSAPRRRENTRARLLEAAEDVFVRQGVRRVTVDDLVGAAGFTRGAFYSNFSSIEQVFFAVFERQSERMLDIVRGVVESVPEEEFTLDTVGELLEALAPVGRRWYVIQSEFTLLALRSESARELLAQSRSRFEEHMREAIADVVRRLGREPTIPIEQLSETAMALYLHSLAQDDLGFGALNTEQLVHTVLPQLILGLSRES